MIADLEHATFSNIESQDINFAKHSIVPECVNWGSRSLCVSCSMTENGKRYEIEFNMEGLVRGDMQSRYQRMLPASNDFSCTLMILGLKRTWAG